MFISFIWYPEIWNLFCNWVTVALWKWWPFKNDGPLREVAESEWYVHILSLSLVWSIFALVLTYAKLFATICFQIIAPQFKHFQKLRDFVEMKLPPGFPVKVDIPVLPTVSARVTFHDFAWKNTNSKRSSKVSSVNGGTTEATNGNASGSDESCGEGERSSH